MRPRNRTVPIVRGALLLALGAWPLTAQVALAAAPPPTAPIFASAAPEAGPLDAQPGVLLLRNGELLSGRIARVGDYYEVLLPHGRIRLRAAEVETACRDLEEGYQHKRAAIRPDDARAHLRLAWWCLHHEMPGHAAAELADATRLDPDDPMIDFVRRRLELALDPPKPSATSAAAAAADAADVAAAAGQSGPSLEELERTVRELPPGAVGRFRQVIQPLLWNSCGLGQCHGRQGSESFRLLRAPHGQVPTRRLTQRNLHSVLSQIDRTNPAQSPLLRAARTAHGTVRSAPGAADQQGIAPTDASQYRMLSAWVAGLAAPHSQAHQTATQMQQSNGQVQQAAAAADPSAQSSAGNAQAAVFVAPIDGPLPQPAAAGASGSSLAPGAPSAPAAQGLAEQAPSAGIGEETRSRESNVQYGARLEVFEPVDAFDPQIFNRRYFPDAPGSDADPGRSDAEPLPETPPLPLSTQQPTGRPGSAPTPIWQARPQPPEPESETPAAPEVQPRLIPRAQSSRISPR